MAIWLTTSTTEIRLVKRLELYVDSCAVEDWFRMYTYALELYLWALEKFGLGSRILRRASDKPGMLYPLVLFSLR